MNPFSALLKSRKFWLIVCDAFVGTVGIVLTWFFAPEKVAEYLALFGLWQPVLYAVVNGITQEDNAQRAADTARLQSKNDVIIAQAYTEAKSAAE